MPHSHPHLHSTSARLVSVGRSCAVPEDATATMHEIWWWWWRGARARVRVLVVSSISSLSWSPSSTPRASRTSPPPHAVCHLAPRKRQVLYPMSLSSGHARHRSRLHHATFSFLASCRPTVDISISIVQPPPQETDRERERERRRIAHDEYRPTSQPVVNTQPYGLNIQAKRLPRGFIPS